MNLLFPTLFLIFSISIRAQVLDVSSHNQHTCVLLSGGTVKCWGSNRYGQLGTGDTVDINQSPFPEVNVGGPVSQIVTGMSHTCALLTTGTIRCWGLNDNGQLGYGHTNPILTMPPADVPLTGTASKIFAGGHSVCAILSTGQVYCWGQNNDGQLEIVNSTNPTPTQITLGSSHLCALYSTQNIKCWGSNTMGQVGYVTQTNPPDVNVGGTVSQISAGHYHTCAVLTTQKLTCWGYGSNGQLGNGAIANIQTMPPPEVPITEGISQVAPAYDYTCVVLIVGTVKCFGDGKYGKLGYESISNVITMPPPNLNLGNTVTKIVVGMYHTCALISQEIKCWGRSLENGNGISDLGDTPGEMPPPSLLLFTPTSPASTSPASTSPASTSPTSGCPLPQPTISSICQGNVWVINQPVDNNNALSITSTVIIQGNFTQSSTGELKVDLRAGRLQVTGCTRLNGTLILESVQLLTASELEIIRSNCIEGNFERVEASLNECDEAQTRVSSRGLSVLLASSTKCKRPNRKLIIIGSSVAAGCVLVFIIVFIIWYLRIRHGQFKFLTGIFRENDGAYNLI